MSTENITAFFDKARQDEVLAGKIKATFAEAETATASALADLSTEAGHPFTAEEFLKVQSESLSDADLEQVTGGTFLDSLGNAFQKIVSTPNIVKDALSPKR